MNIHVVFVKIPKQRPGSVLLQSISQCTTAMVLTYLSSNIMVLVSGVLICFNFDAYATAFLLHGVYAPGDKGVGVGSMNKLLTDFIWWWYNTYAWAQHTIRVYAYG